MPNYSSKKNKNKKNVSFRLARVEYWVRTVFISILLFESLICPVEILSLSLTNNQIKDQ